MYGAQGDDYWSDKDGTYFWVDPFEDLTCVMMMAAPDRRVRYRQIIRALAYQAIAD